MSEESASNKEMHQPPATMMMMPDGQRKDREFCVVLHGGAGVISREIDSVPYYAALEAIVLAIYAFIKANPIATAVDVCEFAVKLLEDEPLFNAGKGAVLTNLGTHELEASIMDGSNLKCGAVSMIQKVKNPISVARLVMDSTQHNYIIGESAENLAKIHGLEFVENSYFTTERRRSQLLAAKEQEIVALDHNIHKPERGGSSGGGSASVSEAPNAVSGSGVQGSSSTATTSTTSKLDEAKGGSLEGNNSKFGTVGAVCMYRGSLAAATSTGGMTNKMSGRIGDSPIIGAGTYASNETCAVSATGWGEEFMRRVAAYDIAARMKYGAKDLETACREAVFEYLPHESGGIIAVDTRGNISMDHNSPGMFRGMICDSNYIGGEVNAMIGIWKEMIHVVLPSI